MSETKRIYLSPPHMGGTEKKYIKEAFDTNWVAPLGPNVDAFEEALSSYCRVKSAAALSSGTAGIHLALILLGIKPGDEVIAPSFTFSATINPIIYLGARPVLIDSEPGTWNMDPSLLEQAITERINSKKDKSIKAIIVVHLYGMPANLGRIMEIADKYDIPVIEDAAEALGSRYNGRPVGSFGKLAILSFNGNKIITTSGGGALLSDDEDMIKKARFLATQARDKAPHYQHSQIGYNYRMSNVLAGIGRGQMEVIESRVKKRRETFAFYKEHLAKFDGIQFLEEPSGSYFSNRWLTTIIVDPEKTGTTREVLQNNLELKNIESRPLWKPMHLQPVFTSCSAYLNGISESLFKNGLCLPSGSGLSDDDLQRTLHVIKDSFN
jgi:dTDP-4-amino-4,6-dideoxygalactose transaminase